MLSPLEDEPAVEDLLEPIPLTPEQMTAQAEADERDRQRQREWALVVQALNDNSLAVVRAMRRFRSETEQEKVERILTSYEDGSFLIDRLGAGWWSIRILLSCCSISAVGSSTSTATHRG